jgi:hypothetical protein
MNYWTSSKRNVKLKTYTLADGINQGIESIEIGDGQLTSAVNVDSFLYPTLSVRDGFTQHSAKGSYINHLTKFNGALVLANSQGIYKYSGGSWQTIYEFGSADNTRFWDSVVFMDKLYFLAKDLQLREYDGTTVNTMSAAPTGTNKLTSHANRLYIVKDNTLYYSALRKPSDWSTVDDAGQIVVETSDGEKMSALVSYADHVMVFKKYTYHELFGTGPKNYTMREGAKIGAVSNRAIVEVNGVLYWLGTDGVYAYLGGAAPDLISKDIDPVIRSINPSYYDHCVMGTDGRFLYLTLVTDGNTMPNVTWKYDTQRRSWWKESYVATAFYLDGQTFYFGTVDGKLYKKGGVNDNGIAISWEAITKPYIDGDEITKKVMHRLYVVADIDAGSTLEAYYSPDAEGENWIKAGSITPTGTLQNARIPIIGVPSEWIRIKLKGTGRAKIHRLVREMSRRG